MDIKSDTFSLFHRMKVRVSKSLLLCVFYHVLMATLVRGSPVTPPSYNLDDYSSTDRALQTAALRLETDLYDPEPEPEYLQTGLPNKKYVKVEFVEKQTTDMSSKQRTVRGASLDQEYVSVIIRHQTLPTYSIDARGTPLPLPGNKRGVLSIDLTVATLRSMFDSAERLRLDRLARILARRHLERAGRRWGTVVMETKLGTNSPVTVYCCNWSEMFLLFSLYRWGVSYNYMLIHNEYRNLHMVSCWSVAD